MLSWQNGVRSALAYTSVDDDIERSRAVSYDKPLTAQHILSSDNNIIVFTCRLRVCTQIRANSFTASDIIMRVLYISLLYYVFFPRAHASFDILSPPVLWRMTSWFVRDICLRGVKWYNTLDRSTWRRTGLTNVSIIRGLRCTPECWFNYYCLLLLLFSGGRWRVFYSDLHIIISFCRTVCGWILKICYNH